MLQITINGNKIVSASFDNHTVEINNNIKILDLIPTSAHSFQIIRENITYHAEVIEADKTLKKYKIKVNNNIYLLEAKDKYDLLIAKLNLQENQASKYADIKAPMPGLILQIFVSPGTEVVVGDSLLVLEAMKMENIIKSPHAGIVKDILIEKGNTVEKNQVLLKF